MDVLFQPIGIIHTPFENPTGAPIQPRFAEGAAGHVEVFEEFVEGIADLAGFSHLHLIYIFHRSSGFSLRVTPYLDDQERGLFATRAPRRPNPIGLSVVRLVGVDGNRLLIEDVDIVDGTPLLDIKPFSPAIDNRDGCRVGWMENARFTNDRGTADDRFSENTDR